MDPAGRTSRLNALAKRLTTNKVSMDVLKEWGMTMNPKLVEIKGRMMAPEEIYVGKNQRNRDGKFVYSVENADWSGGDI
jgi:hypothetical protein